MVAYIACDASNDNLVWGWVRDFKNCWLLFGGRIMSTISPKEMSNGGLHYVNFEVRNLKRINLADCT